MKASKLSERFTKPALHDFTFLFYYVIIKCLKEIFMIVDIQKEKLSALKDEFKFIKECL